MNWPRKNTHGDFYIAQVIVKEGELVTIDWTQAGRNPACFEVLISYTYAVPECKDGAIDTAKFMPYLDEYQKYAPFKLTEYDLKMMPYLLYHHCALWSFTPPYDNLPDEYKKIAALTDKLANRLYDNVDSLSRELYKIYKKNILPEVDVMKPNINNYDDVLNFLDTKVATVEWDEFYGQRKFQAPFITQNTLPDENLVAFLNMGIPIKSALELGCGEGRNAIYMAKHGIDVTAFDISPVAVANAKHIAKDLKIDFKCHDIIKDKINGRYDFIYDSGLLHHLPPHRRITYIELLRTALKPGGYFGLTCFAWGENCAEEVNDWEFYEQKFSAGVAFTRERLVELFSPFFETIEIRKYKNQAPDTIQGLQFMWVCLFKDKRG
ncbi:MAG: class I SAM-dependent methyltransferase [Firmicutes bacterium]|nr:class I SAM-dependent methyltransferase [Bacillota bacterium]